MFVLRSPSILAMTTPRHIPADHARHGAVGVLATSYAVETYRQDRWPDSRRDGPRTRRSCKR